MLDYDFALDARGHSFAAREYDGRALDWHDFALTKRSASTAPAIAARQIQIIPNQLSFPAAPDPRLWAFEAGADDLGQPASDQGSSV